MLANRPHRRTLVTVASFFFKLYFSCPFDKARQKDSQTCHSLLRLIFQYTLTRVLSTCCQCPRVRQSRLVFYSKRGSQGIVSPTKCSLSSLPRLSSGFFPSLSLFLALFLTSDSPLTLSLRPWGPRLCTSRRLLGALSRVHGRTTNIRSLLGHSPDKTYSPFTISACSSTCTLVGSD
ncbi:unnamed protein product [Protopolystoma xenopodis]|uniref:Uncharacterized protein n=1 Tax=Protopolystoma xenopodis TaxID=117903 RepID=A0A448XNX4_9PLAT|nr:unnamed protein product [Protopolystoma xenopodis]